MFKHFNVWNLTPGKLWNILYAAATSFLRTQTASRKFPCGNLVGHQAVNSNKFRSRPSPACNPAFTGSRSLRTSALKSIKTRCREKGKLAALGPCYRMHRKLCLARSSLPGFCEKLRNGDRVHKFARLRSDCWSTNALCQSIATSRERFSPCPQKLESLLSRSVTGIWYFSIYLCVLRKTIVGRKANNCDRSIKHLWSQKNVSFFCTFPGCRGACGSSSAGRWRF